MQPFLGAWSDLTETRWGRRRPFILCGAVGLCVCLPAFAEVTSHTSMRSESCRTSDTCVFAQTLAILLILVINISASAMQMGLRALLVDTCASHEQSKANAWTGRLTNAANVFCYLLSYTDIPRLLPWTGSTQLQALSRLGAFWIGITQATTCLCAGESQFDRESVEEPNLPRRWSVRNWSSLGSVKISRRMWVIQGVQFLSWFAWFPFLSYISRYVFHLLDISFHNNFSSDIILHSYVDQLARNEMLRADGYSNSHVPIYAIQAEASNEQSGNRYGPLALLCFASVALLTISFAPSLCSSLAFRYGVMGWKTRIWYVSQLLYATSLVGVIIMQSAAGLIFVAAMAGMSWAVTQWIPFTLINMEILNKNRASTGKEWAAWVQSLSLQITSDEVRDARVADRGQRRLGRAEPCCSAKLACSGGNTGSECRGEDAF